MIGVGTGYESVSRKPVVSRVKLADSMDGFERQRVLHA